MLCLESGWITGWHTIFWVNNTKYGVRDKATESDVDERRIEGGASGASILGSERPIAFVYCVGLGVDLMKVTLNCIKYW